MDDWDVEVDVDVGRGKPWDDLRLECSFFSFGMQSAQLFPANRQCNI